MKKSIFSKLLILVLVAVTAASTAVAGTMAYLQKSAGTQVNKFAVGTLGVVLTEETGVVGADHKVVQDETGASYDLLVPGDKIIKKVTVKNEGTIDSYVEVTVTLKNEAGNFAKLLNLAIDETYGDDKAQAVYDYMFDGWGLNHSKDLDGDGQNDAGMRLTITGDDMPKHVLQVDSVKTIDEYAQFYTGNWFGEQKDNIPFDGYYTEDMGKYELRYIYYIDLEAKEETVLFNGLNIPMDFSANQLAMFEGLTIEVTAEAVQKEGFANARSAFLSMNEGDGRTVVAYWPETEWKEADENWGSDNDYTITTVEQLVAFAKKVNGGNTFAGKTVTLGADLDLDGKLWTPIGTSSNSFNGTFDGNGHTISNLYVGKTGMSNVGLFGVTQNGTIKNLTIDNAYAKGRLNVAALAGTPYTSKYENIKLTGRVEVEGMAYVGSLGGKNAYANWTDITVDVETGSYVKANSVENGTAYRTYVGGVIGFMGEGSHSLTNVTSNIDVFGSTCDVGGIVGIAHYENSYINVTCSGNVTITDATETDEAEEMGGIAGVWHNENGTKVTFKNCAFTGTLTANYTEGVDLSNNTLVGKPYSAAGTGNLVIE